LIQRKPDVRIIEGEACPDHIHMLLEIPPNIRYQKLWDI